RSVADLVFVYGRSKDASPSRARRVAGRRHERMLDLTMQAIQASLDGLAARQRITAQNIANAETPGYLAQDVTFEDSLSAAISNGDPTQATIAPGPTNDPVNINGNNVSVDKETLSMVDTGLRYQLATESMNNKFRVLHDSMRQDM